MKLNIKKALPIVAGAAGGAIAAKMIDEKALQNVPIPAKIKPLLFVAGGLFLSGNKSDIVKGLGLGMAGYGGLKLYQSFTTPAAADPGTEAATTGVGNYADEYMNGVFAAQNVLSGVYEDPSDPQLLGYGTPIRTMGGVGADVENVLSGDVSYASQEDSY